MATKEAKKDEAASDEAAAPPRKSKKLLIIVIAAVVATLAIGTGLGFMIGHRKAPEGDAHAAEAAEEKKKEEEKHEPKAPPVFVALDPFTVNLQPESSGSGDQFLQLVVSLRVHDEKAGEELKSFMPQIRHEILNLAGSKKASEITSPDGRENLADDIQDVVNDVMGYKPPKRGRRKEEEGKDKEAPEEPPVMAVFFTQFIVQ